jgi:plastocyanin
VSSGWQGRRPASIEGETNPTLELTTGTTYALTWKNTNGKKHELIITDDSGTELESTESTKTKGATQTVAFTAEPAMVSYYDTYHPESMRGEIRVNIG